MSVHEGRDGGGYRSGGVGYLHMGTWDFESPTVGKQAVRILRKCFVVITMVEIWLMMVCFCQEFRSCLILTMNTIHRSRRVINYSRCSHCDDNGIFLQIYIFLLKIGHYDTYFCHLGYHHEWVLTATTMTRKIDLFCRCCRSVNEPFTKVVTFRFAIKYTKQRNTTSTLCKKWSFYSSKRNKNFAINHNICRTLYKRCITDSLCFMFSPQLKNMEEMLYIFWTFDA